MNEFLELLYVTGILEEEKIEISNNNYLQKGIRIQTLAREKQLRLYKEIQDRTVRFCDLDIKALNYNTEIACKQIKSAIRRKIRKLCSQIKSKEQIEEFIVPIFKGLLLSLDGISVKYDKRPSDSLLSSICGTNHILQFELYDQRYYIPVNPKKSFRNGEYYYKSIPDKRFKLLHIEEIYLYLYVISKLNEIIKTNGEDLFGEISGETVSFLQLKMVIYNYWSQDTIPKWVLEYLNPYIFNNKDKSADKLKYQDQLKDDALLEWADSYKYVIDYVHASKKINSSIFLPGLYSNKYLHCILSFGIYVITYLYKNTQELYENHKEYKLNSHTATVYQTKKNIPNKIVKIMRTSPLNQYFGYVEFDESVDIERVHLITKEFLLLNKNFFGNMKYPDKIIRFRKLGRHKAAGLYFKYFGTLAVDIRYPDSMIHELFHLIDDMMGDLSSQLEFMKIAERYQSVLIRIMKDDEANGIIHISKSGKYNLKYYLKKCEIFARCGEIYLFRIKQVKSSLLKQDNTISFAYPDDKQLNELIEKYYSDLLVKIKSMQISEKEDVNEKHICVANKRICCDID